jgi:maltose alpha-D-glucosyltransferase/alpha-amylase
VTLVLRENLGKVLSTTAEAVIAREILPQYIVKRRWFGLKDQSIESTRIAHLTNIGEAGREFLLGEVQVKGGGGASCWLLPLAILWEDEPSAALPNRLALARVRRGRRLGLLTDAFALPSFAHRFVSCLAAGQRFEHADGVVRFQATESGREQLKTKPDAEVNWLAAEQSKWRAFSRAVGLILNLVDQEGR